MATKTLSFIAKQMRQLDICMMVTQGKSGVLNSRPMSNNGDVKYNGSSYFFTYEGTRKVKDLSLNTQLALNFEGKDQLYISVKGKARLIRNKDQFAQHWDESLGQWFKDGIDTKGMVLIHVKGSVIEYWQREAQGKIKV